MLITSYNSALWEVMPATSQSEAMQSKILLFANLLTNMHNKSMQLFSELLNKIQTFGKPLTFIEQPQPPNNS